MNGFSHALVRRLILLVFVVFAVAIASFGYDQRYKQTDQPSTSTASSANATITRVVDGDTVVVRIGKRIEHVRLIGIDTPEVVDPRRPPQCYGKEASAYTKSLLPHNSRVRLVLDAESRDAFHRILAYAYRESDGLFVNAAIAENGYATTLSRAPNTAHSREFQTLVLQAKQDRRGLWGACPEIPLK